MNKTNNLDNVNCTFMTGNLGCWQKATLYHEEKTSHDTFKSKMANSCEQLEKSMLAKHDMSDEPTQGFPSFLNNIYLNCYNSILGCWCYFEDNIFYIPKGAEWKAFTNTYNYYNYDADEYDMEDEDLGTPFDGQLIADNEYQKYINTALFLYNDFLGFYNKK